MQPVKKVFNVEYDLTSEEFKAQKQDEISQKCQDKHPDFICKVTTFCVPDKQLVVHTTQENQEFMGSADKLLAQRPLQDQSFLTMDDDMVRTYEITITAGTDLPDYVTALNIAQAKADEMFEENNSKLPLVTVIDYRWGNAPTTLTASIFSDTDEDGNSISLVGATDSAANVVVGDGEAGISYYKIIEEIQALIADSEKASDNNNVTFKTINCTGVPYNNATKNPPILGITGSLVTHHSTANDDDYYGCYTSFELKNSDNEYIMGGVVKVTYINPKSGKSFDIYLADVTTEGARDGYHLPSSQNTIFNGFNYGDYSNKDSEDMNLRDILASLGFADPDSSSRINPEYCAVILEYFSDMTVDDAVTVSAAK